MKRNAANTSSTGTSAYAQRDTKAGAPDSSDWMTTWLLLGLLGERAMPDDRLEEIKERWRVGAPLGPLDVPWLFAEIERSHVEVEKLKTTLKLSATSLVRALDILGSALAERDQVIEQLTRPSPN